MDGRLADADLRRDLCEGATPVVLEELDDRARRRESGSSAMRWVSVRDRIGSTTRR